MEMYPCYGEMCLRFTPVFFIIKNAPHLVPKLGIFFVGFVIFSERRLVKEFLRIVIIWIGSSEKIQIEFRFFSTVIVIPIRALP